MSDLALPLAGVRAVVDLVAAAERAEAVWTRPRAPGKWSPSQVVEHVARIKTESAITKYLERNPDISEKNRKFALACIAGEIQ